eukprot:108322_1
MSPLSLYESIFNGGIFSLHNVSQTNIVPLTQSYPDIPRMLKHYAGKRAIDISSADIKDKIWSLSPLPVQNTRDSEQFVWEPTLIELRGFITEEKDCIVSHTKKSLNGSQLYFEMSSTTHKQHKTKRCGAISLTLFSLPSKQNHAIISCQFYCEQMDFYARFEDAIIKLDGNESNAKQIAFFEWEHLERAIASGKTIEWQVVISHKDIKRVNVHDDSKDAITCIMKEHKLEASGLHDKMTNDTACKYLPLHRFDENRICNVIRCWVFNDSRFTDHLEKMITIFSDFCLSGERIKAFSMTNIRRILEQALLGFMTKETSKIIFNRIEYWKTANKKHKSDKTFENAMDPEDIAYSLATFPLNKLLARICNRNDAINGEKFIQYYVENYPWIHNVTGWNETETYQIHAVLFKYDAFSSSEIKQNMKRVSSAVSNAIADCIEN